ILARHLRIEPHVLAPLLRIAGIGALQVLIETASWLGLVRILSSYGSTALAGYTIAMHIAIFAMLPSWGLAGGAATLVGQNLGAGEPLRAQRSVETIALYNVIVLGSIGVAFALFPDAVVSVVTSDREVTAYAASCLRIVALGFLFFGFGMVAVQAFNGAGDTLTPMIINVSSFWFFKIPLAYVLAKVVGMGPRGVFIAITAAYSIQAIVAGLLFRRGRWKTRTIE
ncbi:MAG TPA: MATE family efflux transporter, partial [Labilithrix sp.]|nr:MATE family efflux transporter [Labilithrix sp.]